MLAGTRLLCTVAVHGTDPSCVPTQAESIILSGILKQFITRVRI